MAVCMNINCVQVPGAGKRLCDEHSLADVSQPVEPQPKAPRVITVDVIARARKGGVARKERLTAERRSTIAREAALVRWAK